MNGRDVHSGSPHDRRPGRQARLLRQLHPGRPRLGDLDRLGAEEAGYSVFFQDWDFQGNFVLEMDKAHNQSRRTIAVLSPDYLASRFAAPEWAARFAQDATSEHDLLIPVRVRPCELEGLLAQIVYVDLVGCGEAAARDKLLRRVEGIRLKPDEPPLFPGLGPATRPCPSGLRSQRRHRRADV